MAFEIRFSAAAERDFELIFNFLFDNYTAFGESAADAIDHAERRVQAIRAEIEGLTRTPHIGTLHPEIMPGLRHVTLGRTIVWFDIREPDATIRILALYFGGQDHLQQMLARLRQ